MTYMYFFPPVLYLFQSKYFTSTNIWNLNVKIVRKGSYTKTMQWYRIRLNVSVCKHCYEIYVTVCIVLFSGLYAIHLSCTGSRHSIQYAADSQTGSMTHIQNDKGDGIVGSYQLPVLQHTTRSASQVGQFGTVSYLHIHHGHWHIAVIHHVLSQHMSGHRHSLYLDPSVRQLLEMFARVQSIRDRHKQTPGVTDRR